MSQISNNPQSLNTLKQTQPQLGDSLAKQGFSLDDPALVGAASVGLQLAPDALEAISAALAGIQANGTGGAKSCSAHAPTAPNFAAATSKGYVPSDQVLSSTFPLDAASIGNHTGQFDKNVMSTIVGLTTELGKEVLSIGKSVDEMKGEVRNTDIAPTSTKGKSIMDLTLEDVINDPNLTFEELLQKVMMIIARDQQSEILGKLEELTGLNNAEAALNDVQTIDSPSGEDGTVDGGHAVEGPGGSQPTGETGGAPAAASSSGATSGAGDFLRGLDSGDAAMLMGIGSTLVGSGGAVAVATGATGVGGAVGVGMMVAGGVAMGAAAAIEMGGAEALADAADALLGPDDDFDPNNAVHQAERNIALVKARKEAEAAEKAGGSNVVSPTAFAKKGQSAPPAEQTAASRESEGTMTTEDKDAQSRELASSKALLMEDLKFHVQRMSEMMQAISGVLNASHDGAMNTIRNIK